MKRLFFIIGALFLCALGFEAFAASCVLDTSTAKKTKASLACLQKRIAVLEGLKPISAPVTVYEDSFVRIEMIGKSRTKPDLDGNVLVSLPLRITNKTSDDLRVGYDNGNDPLLTDDTGVSDAATYYSDVAGINGVSSYSTADYYSLVAPKSRRTFTLYFAAKFKGNYFDLNMNFFRWEPDPGQGVPFVLNYINIAIPAP
jgi:hypothetical protein